MAKLHLVVGFKTRTDRREESLLSVDQAGRAGQESFHSFLVHKADQDVVKHPDGVEMLKILCRLPCLEIDANALKECMNMKSFSKHWSHLVTSKFELFAGVVAVNLSGEEVDGCP